MIGLFLTLLKLAVGGIIGYILGAMRRRKIEAACTDPDRSKSSDAEHGLRWRE